MSPQQMALAVAKIKIRFARGEDHIVGLLASEKVKETADEDYLKRYGLFTFRYSAKVGNVRIDLKRNHSEYTEAEIEEGLLNKIGSLHTHTYEHWKDGSKSRPSNQGCEAQKRAMSAGEKLKKVATEYFGDADVNL